MKMRLSAAFCDRGLRCRLWPSLEVQTSKSLRQNLSKQSGIAAQGNPRHLKVQHLDSKTTVTYRIRRIFSAAVVVATLATLGFVGQVIGVDADKRSREW